MLTMTNDVPMGRPCRIGFRWSMRDNVNYQQNRRSILDWSAKHAKEILRDFYQTGYNSWRKGIEEKPFAYVIPANQPDRRRVAQMINRLRDQHIEVGTLRTATSLHEGNFERGDYIVELDQPYRNFAVDVLEPQRFPAETEELPYDGHVLGLPGRLWRRGCADRG